MGIIAALLVTACGEQSDEAVNTPVNTPTNASNTAANSPVKTVSLDVYKSPTCGCCTEWVKHVETRGFNSEIHHPDDLNAIKNRFGIAPRLQSCHTAVTEEGYVFEGHIPAKTMQRFLDNPPADAIGLAVPGMPVGSPGMEVNDRFMAYRVLLVKNDGSTEVFATFDDAEAQY